MSLDFIPVEIIFVVTIIVVMAAVEAGYMLGRKAHRHSEDEKESPVSAIAGSILGLLAFILAFSFGIVTERYDARKGLVRDEANAIRAAWLRSDILPDKADRVQAAALLKEYLDQRLAAVMSGDMAQVRQALVDSDRIQRQLWDLAVAKTRTDMNSDYASLYIESLNDMISIHAMRVAVGMQTRTPLGIWATLYALIVLAMVAIGYQTGIAGSRRSWATLILAISLSMVIAMIAALDNPTSGYLTVSHQPLQDVQALMSASSEPLSK